MTKEELERLHAAAVGMTQKDIQHMYEMAAGITKAELERRYEAALAAKEALGPEHDPHDSCECPICEGERDLYFIDRHFLDDMPRGHKRMPVDHEKDGITPLRDEDLPFWLQED